MDVDTAAAGQVAKVLIHVPVELDAFVPVPAATHLRPPLSSRRGRIERHTGRVALKDGTGEPLDGAARLGVGREPIGGVERERHCTILAQHRRLRLSQPQRATAEAVVERLATGDSVGSVEFGRLGRRCYWYGRFRRPGVRGWRRAAGRHLGLHRAKDVVDVHGSWVGAWRSND